MSVDFEKIRKLFPVTETFTYFLANGKSPLPTPVVDAAKQMLDGMMNSGVVAAVLSQPMIEETREKAAVLLGCDADEIAFSKNTAEGALWVAQSMPWEEGDEVLITNHEYATLVYPFMAQEHTGMKVKLVDQDNRRITPEVIENGFTDRTRLVAVSWPQFDNGHRCDLEAISKICRERGALLFVDPIQCLGSIRLNVRDAGVDFLSAGTHKGLFGPMGLGVFYCRKPLLEKLRPVHCGWGSMETEPDAEYNTVPYKFEPAMAARRYEEGARNMVGIAALNAALDLIEELGAENIENRVKEITDYLCEQAEAKGCEIVSPRGEGEWSGIVLMRLPKQDPHEFEVALRDDLILVHAMRGCLITGTNFYNNREDVDRLVSRIEAG